MLMAHCRYFFFFKNVFMAVVAAVIATKDEVHLSLN